ncbi:superinfection immunity protein [Paraburkholderia caballeronis]|uniref:superinfection immunity protein n=1 Tax=Paraburkholderia caballeronis TaxID=416943 RepID=UPI0010658AD4|nr:superinfection immunity protein [Paraburkholderia caballeronis]TDV13878.1 T4 superinfection immunity protein [Paraburkholderia caballeronis]TDV15392.1 T4 superinfection immunity protein [Paraburkholderia caballeronis]TDV24859.1 T4 superinfection immunity protein [Paraburkholderia caballeronis]
MQSHPVVLAAALAAALALYFLPALIADRRRRSDLLTIALFNAVLGWTVLGWLLALFWAFQRNPPQDLAVQLNEKQRYAGMRGFSRRLSDRVQARAARLADRERPSR